MSYLAASTLIGFSSFLPAIVCSALLMQEESSQGFDSALAVAEAEEGLSEGLVVRSPFSTTLLDGPTAGSKLPSEGSVATGDTSAFSMLLSSSPDGIGTMPSEGSGDASAVLLLLHELPSKGSLASGGVEGSVTSGIANILLSEGSITSRGRSTSTGLLCKVSVGVSTLSMLPPRGDRSSSMGTE